MITKITGRFVIGFDEDDHVIYPYGEVVYQDDTIIFVGHNYLGAVDETFDEGDSIIAPGFIDLNALGDIDQSLLWGEAVDWRGMLWSEAYIQAGPHETMTFDEETFKSRYAMVQLLLNGITTALPVTGLEYKSWAETYNEFSQAAEFAAKIGLRTYLGPSFRSSVEYIRGDGSVGSYWDERLGYQGLEEAVRFINDYSGKYDGLINGLLVPSQFQTCTPDLLSQTKSFSNQLHCPIRLHAAQSMREYLFSKERYQMTPLQFLDSIGFLSPLVFIPHAIYISSSQLVDDNDERDLDILYNTQTTVIHCPLVLARSGILMESFDRFSLKGIRLAIGTDTFPPDIIQNFRIGTILNQVANKGTAVSRPADFFRAATIGGARALGRSDLGRISPGAKADIVVLSLTAATVGQYDDPIETMVFSMSNNDISKVIINGRIVMENGTIPGIDLQEMRIGSQSYFNKLKKSYTQRDYLKRSEEQLFPASFKTIEKPEGY